MDQRTFVCLFCFAASATSIAEPPKWVEVMGKQSALRRDLPAMSGQVSIDVHFTLYDHLCGQAIAATYEFKGGIGNATKTIVSSTGFVPHYTNDAGKSIQGYNSDTLIEYCQDRYRINIDANLKAGRARISGGTVCDDAGDSFALGSSCLPFVGRQFPNPLPASLLAPTELEGGVLLGKFKNVHGADVEFEIDPKLEYLVKRVRIDQGNSIQEYKITETMMVGTHIFPKKVEEKTTLKDGSTYDSFITNFQPPVLDYGVVLQLSSLPPELRFAGTNSGIYKIDESGELKRIGSTGYSNRKSTNWTALVQFGSLIVLLFSSSILLLRRAGKLKSWFQS